MTALTLPGALRPCSPVIVTRSTYAGLRGVVVSIADGIAMVAIDRPSISSLIALGLDDLALDLTDPTGRAHAAWWLEAQPVWSNVYRRSEGAWWFGERFGIPYLGSGSFCAAARPRRAPWDFRWAIVVPALANLVDDGRLLPDGSRRVDAEALRLVCLHVAGVPS